MTTINPSNSYQPVLYVSSKKNTLRLKVAAVALGIFVLGSASSLFSITSEVPNSLERCRLTPYQVYSERLLKPNFLEKLKGTELDSCVEEGQWVNNRYCSWQLRQKNPLLVEFPCSKEEYEARLRVHSDLVVPQPTKDLRSGSVT